MALPSMAAQMRLLSSPHFHRHQHACMTSLLFSTPLLPSHTTYLLQQQQLRLACQCSDSTPAFGDNIDQESDRGEAYRVLEDQCRSDPELQEILSDCFVDPQNTQKRVEKRVKRKEKNLLQHKTGSHVPMQVSFRDFDPHDSFIWLELYDIPSDEDVEFFGNVLRSWYILGNLGSFNSLNLQLTRSPADKKPDYSSDNAAQALPCKFQNAGNLEFRHKWGRLWVDLGTSDTLSWDVLINTLVTVSSDHIGIKQLVFGGKAMGGWKENQTSSEVEYKVYTF